MTLAALKPRQTVPALPVSTLAQGPFTLGEDTAPHFTLVVFYRGLHCPICLKYLLELGRLQPEFDKLGVKVIAIRHRRGGAALRARPVHRASDGTLYGVAVQNMPFARPHFDELLAAVDFALARNDPARGEYIGSV